MAPHRSFDALLIVLFLAFVVPLLLSRFKRLRVPIVVGEILAGILIGPHGLGWVPRTDPALDFLAELGFVFLMFLSGMEIDFSSLGGGSDPSSAKGSEWGPVGLALASFGITLVLAAAVGLGMAQAGWVRNPWMMALILSTTSLGVVLPVLREQRLSSGRYGQTLLVAALIADFATMLLITILVALLSHGLSVNILLIAVLFMVFF